MRRHGVLSIVLCLIHLTHVRVYSRATHDDFFLLSPIQRSDKDRRLLAFLSSSITSTDKNCSQTKKRPRKRSFRLSGGLLVSEFFQSEKQRSLDDHGRRMPIDATAISAFSFEGHISAAVSRGPAPGRSRGWRGPAFDRSYCACPELTMTFFCFLRSNDRTKTGVCLLSFLLRSLRLTKTVLKPKKKGHASALPAPVAGSSYLSSSKVKNKDRWTTNAFDRAVSVEQTERASSHKLEREGHFPCPAHGTGL